ncbi:MAG: hypothetical protein VX777_10080 [Chlamydiota bacterium]|nr:hypothetical protein [Chlamydiota bacterium]
MGDINDLGSPSILNNPEINPPGGNSDIENQADNDQIEQPPNIGAKGMEKLKGVWKSDAGKAAIIGGGIGLAPAIAVGALVVGAVSLASLPFVLLGVGSSLSIYGAIKAGKGVKQSAPIVKAKMSQIVHGRRACNLASGMKRIFMENPKKAMQAAHAKKQKIGLSIAERKDVHTPVQQKFIDNNKIDLNDISNSSLKLVSEDDHKKLDSILSKYNDNDINALSSRELTSFNHIIAKIEKRQSANKQLQFLYNNRSNLPEKQQKQIETLYNKVSERKPLSFKMPNEVAFVQKLHSKLNEIEMQDFSENASEIDENVNVPINEEPINEDKVGDGIDPGEVEINIPSEPELNLKDLKEFGKKGMVTEDNFISVLTLIQLVEKQLPDDEALPKIKARVTEYLRENPEAIRTIGDHELKNLATRLHPKEKLD